MIARVAMLARRLTGAVLALLVILPAYRLLAGRQIGIIGDDILRYNDRIRPVLWSGTFVIACVALLLGRLVSVERAADGARAARRAIVEVGIGWWAAICAVAAFAPTLWFQRAVLHGKPNLIDAMAQLQQARYLAAGRLAGPAGPLAAFWTSQNALVTPHGWVSHYPPGHVVLLAAGMTLGALPLVAPLMAAIAAACAALAADRLLPDRPATARLGALAGALSPLAIAQAGAYMNHVSAAAFGALAIYCAARARSSLGWAVATGIAAGAAFTVRPLAAIVVGAVVLVTWTLGDPAHTPSAVVRRCLAALAGAAPFGAAIAAYNAHFFGAPLRFGYVASQGPSIGLGFHRDPWGNVYGLTEAIGFTASDLATLSLHLLETPLPLVAVVGAFLMLARRLAPGERVIAAWALLPVAANFFYWHHGIFMGPRMLAESVPAWALLAAVAASGIVAMAPRETHPFGVPYSPRVALGGGFAIAALWGLAFLAPERLASYGGRYMASSRLELPAPNDSALVFVHGPWTGRIGARASAAGLRLDSLETLLRQNSTCEAQRWVDAYVSRSPLPPLDLREGSTPLPKVALSFADSARVRPGETITETCAREANSDSVGVLDVTPYLWQHDLPGAERGGAMFVRDLGPEANALLIARFPHRAPWLMTRPESSDRPTLVEYTEGMRRLYGASADPLTSSAAHP